MPSLFNKSILSVVGLGVVFSFSGMPSARADFVVIPPNRIVASIILYDQALRGMRNVVDQVMKIYESKAAASAQIQAARDNFWSNIDNPEGYEDRYRTYLEALLAKDIHYLGAYAALGPGADESIVFSQFGGDIDGGIPPEASPTFNAWVRAVRFALGAREGEMLSLTTTSAEMLAALEEPDVVKAYGEYQVQRDSVEFRDAGFGDFFQEQLARATDSVPVVFEDEPHPLSPTVIRRTYSSAPDRYSPVVDPALFDGGAEYLVATLPRRRMEGALYQYQVTPLDYAMTIRGADSHGAYFAGNPSGAERFNTMGDPRRQQLDAYMTSRFPRQPKLLMCSYDDYRDVVMWLDEVPDFAGLPAELSDVLRIKEKGNQCPPVWPGS